MSRISIHPILERPARRTIRFTFNGEVVTAMGTRADPDRDVIVVDGEVLSHYYQPRKKLDELLVAWLERSSDHG